jgi:polyisoprenoid-binding protein YceI
LFFLTIPLVFRSFFFLSFLAAWLPAFGDNPVWVFQSGSVRFRVSNAGFRVNGSLAAVEASVSFDPRFPEKARISGTARVASIRTGIGLRDRHILKEDYFFEEKYPFISMDLQRMEKQGNALRGVFNLTLKGTLRTVAFPVYFSEDDSGGILSGFFEINRLDFGVGSSSLTLSDIVRVEVQFRLRKTEGSP